MKKKGNSLEDSIFCSESQNSFQKSSNDSPVSPTESFGSVFLSSDGENGTDEKRKAGKSPTGLPQTPTSEMEYFDDRKKVDIARTKSSTDSPLLTMDIKSDSKIERKKRASNQISIPVLSVTLLKKTKTALLVPNALIIATVTDRYMFVSLLSRDTTYKLLKSICRHLEDTGMGNSPNPSSAENSFRADRPTSLPLDFNEDYSDLDGIVQQRRQEMEESSSTGSQTPELECFQDYHVMETETHLKVSKTEAKSVRSDAHIKRGPDRKAQNSSRNGHSEAFRFLHKMKSQNVLSLNHVLIFYAILVCVLIFSTFYMRYKISVLEERLISITSFDSHQEHPVRQGLGSHLQINADALCDELTANIIKLEKIQNNLKKLLEDSE
ncbi:GRAM domain-containing protein 2B isoform X6 [Heliangelus exortis]|uniref:GRAM domain-containing protein 2B isoform X6 n=1 Tax=Heliangelus exortis TaxID=472823 RepID=UPI003A8CD60A